MMCPRSKNLLRQDLGNCRDILRNQVSFPYFRKKENSKGRNPTPLRNDLLNWNSVRGGTVSFSPVSEIFMPHLGHTKSEPFVCPGEGQRRTLQVFYGRNREMHP